MMRTMPAAALPPGPRLPLVGLVGPGRDPLAMLQRLAREHGDVTFFRLGHERCYFVNHPHAIRDVLVTDQRHFTKSRGLERAKKLLGEGLLTSEGLHHLRQRRMLQPAFHRERIAGYGDVMVDYAVRLGERWQPGATYDVAHEMMRLTLAIAGKTLFDTDVESEADEVGGAVTAVLESFWLNLLPGAALLEKLPVPRLRRARAARQRLDALIYRMIAERRASGRDHGDLLSMLIAASDAAEAAGASEGPPGELPPDVRAMSDQQIRDEAMTLLLAGHETTANALTWTWYLLSQHPAVAERVRREVTSVAASRRASARDLPALPYTRQVVMESMRLYPPAWIIGRRSIGEYVIDGYRLPPRAMVFMSPYVMHRDARFFSDPERFAPERWTPQFEAALPKFAYFPFGGGARQCIGEHFAWMEAILVVATLAARWRLQLVPGHPIVLQPLVTLRSRHGLRMTAERLH